MRTKYLIALFFLGVFILFFDRDYLVIDSLHSLVINPRDTFLNFFFSWNNDIMFGYPNTWGQSYIFPFSFLYFIFFYTVENISITQALVFSFVLTFSFVSFLLFLKQELKNCRSLYLFIGSLFYTFNLYTLTSFSGASVALFSYGALPLQLYFLRRIFFRNDYIKNIIGFSFATILMSGINPPLVAINLIVIISYFIYLLFDGLWKKKMFVLKRGLLLFFFVLLTNLYWVAGILSFFGSGGVDMNSILSESLSMQNAQGTYLNVFRTLGLWSFGGGWKGIPYYNYSNLYLNNFIWQITLFVPSILVFFLIAYHNKSFFKQKRLLWALFLFLVSIPMVVATREGIFAHLYNWAYNNIPLFPMFRSSYKFIQVYILALSFFLGYFLFSLDQMKSLNNKKFFRLIKSKDIIVVFLLIIVLLNAFPFFTQRVFEKEKKISEIPEYYYEAKNFFEKDETIYRILVLPPQYFSVFYWGSTAGNPEIIWNKGLVARQAGSEEERSNKLTLELYDALFNKKYEKTFELLKILNVKYIVQRNDYNWEYYRQISKSPEQVADVLKSEFKQVASFGELDVYEVPVMYQGSIVSIENENSYVQYKDESYVKKTITIHNLIGIENLTFLESFHPSWSLYLDRFEDFSCDSLINTNGYTECVHDKSFLGLMKDTFYIFKNSIFNENHKIVYDYANEWLIDANYIKNNYDKSLYKENTDGSINIKLAIYFKPQSYFNIALFFSMLAIAGCFGYLIWYHIKEYKLLKNKEKV